MTNDFLFNSLCVLKAFETDWILRIIGECLVSEGLAEIIEEEKYIFRVRITKAGEDFINRERALRSLQCLT